MRTSPAVLGGLYRSYAQTSFRSDVVVSCEQTKTSHKLEMTGHKASLASETDRPMQWLTMGVLHLSPWQQINVSLHGVKRQSVAQPAPSSPENTRLDNRVAVCSAALLNFVFNRNVAFC